MLAWTLGADMRRRKFISLLGGTIASWPLVARAQPPVMPVIGFLDTRSPDGMTDRLRAFREGLKDSGYVERENVTIEYRWAENQLDRLPEPAAELVRRQVAVIVASEIDGRYVFSFRSTYETTSTLKLPGLVPTSPPGGLRVRLSI